MSAVNSFKLPSIAFVVVMLGLAQSLLAQSSELRRVQEALNAQGYEAGPVDGFDGRRTRSALREFQKDKGLPQTGEVDAGTLARLFEPEAAQGGGRGPEAGAVEPPPPAGEAAPVASAASDATAEAEPGNGQSDGAVAASQEPAIRSEPVESAPKPTEPKEADTAAVLIVIAVFAAMLWFAFRILRFVLRGLGRLFSSGAPDLSGSAPVTPPHRRSAARSAAPNPATIAASRYAAPQPDRKPAASAAAWIPADGGAVIKGRQIGGLVYVGAGPRRDRYSDPDNAFIDPQQPVAPEGGDLAGDGLPYWPNYATITPQARATYLDWLADGRSDPRYDAGYVFLYFYGLERRVFLDQTDAEERAIIVGEVERLLAVYGENRSVRNYLGTFLDAAKMLDVAHGSFEPVFDSPGYEMPSSLLFALGSMIARGESLGADWLLSWYACHPEFHFRTPAKRAQREFRALFGLLFREKFPEGMKVRPPKRTLEMRYHAASGNFSAALKPTIDGEPAPDVSGLRKPLTDIGRIVDAATEALDRYSRYLGRNPDGRGSIEAYGLLPPQIRHLFPCEELEALRAWVRGKIDEDGLVNVETLVERLEGVRPEKLTKRNLTGAADSLAGLGFGMAPDPRFALRRPELGEPVILFDLPPDAEEMAEPSQAYAQALMKLTIGALVIHADGRIRSVEEAHLSQQIAANAALSAAEQSRLSANLKWMIAIPPDLKQLRSKLRRQDASAASVLGQMALLAAAADGVIHPDEIRMLETLYKTLGLNADGLYSELHSLSGDADEPVTVREPDPGPSDHPIPASPTPAPERAVTLDPSRIAAIMENTAEVSRVLGDVFNEEEPEEPEDEQADEPMEAAPSDPFDGLDMAHRMVAVVLITRPTWTEAEFEALAEEQNLMPAGAMETINEWSFGRFDEALIDEYDGYEIAEDVARILQS